MCREKETRNYSAASNRTLGIAPPDKCNEGGCIPHDKRKSKNFISITSYHMEHSFGEIQQTPENYFTSRGTLLE